MIYIFFLPVIREMINNTINMKNRILAILAAPAAMPPNPKIPAIMANMIKVTVQRNIMIVFFRLMSDYLLISTVQISVGLEREFVAFGFNLDSKANR